MTGSSCSGSQTSSSRLARPHTGMSTMPERIVASALWFWLAAFAQVGAHRWRALVALLISGKLFCLLGVLLVFAPRPLYLHATLQEGHAALADQQLAGLLMVVACPLSYVLAGVVIATRWVVGLADAGRRAQAVP